MRAARGLASRSGLSSLIALLALCGSTPAWATVIIEVGNTWSGTLSAPKPASGTFVASTPADLVRTNAEMTLPNRPRANANTMSLEKITSVPEPAIWLMLAGGLGLLGFMRIRRAVHIF